MVNLRNVLRNLSLVMVAVMLTTLTYILGAPFLKVLRRRMGRVAYWTVFTIIFVAIFSLKAQLLAVAFYSMVVLVGVFEEFEEMGLNFRVSGFFTLLINSLLAAGAFALWVFYSGPKWSQILRTNIEAMVKPVIELNPRFQMDVNELILQLPSIAVIAWAVSIYLAVFLEKPSGLANVTQPPLRPQLKQFALPDACVWVFTAALLGAFGNFGSEWYEALSVNVLNVCFLLFFFQGIAVVSRYFESLRMTLFWQWILMFFIVVQLFLLVSVIGLMDYWLNFRARLERRSEQFKSET